ncbi:transposase [Sinirhodobacter populi]|uniref:Transposase n=2 Tax=Paenirhodobacter populi TaxID=2306993 RepID=A0A443KAS4_9RHOB|nr:transposase [Sinirhodobacter populi]RWR29909.1 transposase [Sinirhodobacter populi]
MKSDIRRMAERLLDPTLNHTEVGRLINRNRDTVRRLRRRAVQAGLRPEMLGDLPDARLRDMLMPSGHRKVRCVQPDWDVVVRHILATGDSVLDTYDDIYLKQQSTDTDLPPMSYANFCRELAKILKRRAPEYRHHYRPGEVMQIDFAGFQPVWTDPQNERRKSTLLIAHFPFSQFCLGEVIQSQSRADVIHGLTRIFARLNAAPRRIILDNFKAAIDVARSKRREARINPEFQAFLDHYRIVPDPARGREPRDKGAVEGTVRLSQRYYARVLRDRTPRSMAELNELLQAALEHLNDKVMRRWKMSRNERFLTREMSCLRPLPNTSYDYGNWHPGIRIQRHYHVNVEGRDYSVPSHLIGEMVSIKAMAATIEIYHDSTLVAVHPRRAVTPTDDTPITDPAHMPENHRAIWRQNPDALIARASDYSLSLGRFVCKHLEVNTTPRATYNMLKRLLEVAPVYGKTTIDAACVEALRRDQINADALWQILDRGPKKLPRPEPQPAPTPSENIRGAGYYSEDDDAA